MLDIIEKRYSVRTYSDSFIEPDKICKLQRFISENATGPFGNTIRMDIIDASKSEKSEQKSYGTYGLIKGARVYLAGAVKIGKGAMEDFGYVMELAVLEATRLGLGTVWLGGMLNRTTFGDKLKVSEDEVIPAISPIGYTADKTTFTDKLVRKISGGNNRMVFSELFFSGSFEKPLSQTAAGNIFDAFEAVRWAPSASNKQPWRIVMDGKNTFHFYLHEDFKYNHAIKNVRIQNVDLGIAMSHFELEIKELGIHGEWKVLDTKVEDGPNQYICSYVIN